MTIKFIHSADIHLDSPMLNLERYEAAPVELFRSATRRAFANMVEFAIANDVQLLLISGDLYDGDCRDMNTVIMFRNHLRRLAEHRIRVFIVQGNHDAASRASKAFSLTLPDNTHLFATDHAQSIRLAEEGIVIHGQGFSTPVIEANLAKNFPAAQPGCLNIGMLHSNCDGSADHGNYAPSSIADLEEHGYDYWALGHIHQRRILHQGNPWIVYPGNLQGRHSGECGAKGCTLVVVDEGRIKDLSHHEMDVVRWARLIVDIPPREDLHAVFDILRRSFEEALTQAARPLALRLTLRGEFPYHAKSPNSEAYWRDRFRQLTTDYFEDQIWLEKIYFVGERARPHTKTTQPSTSSAARDLLGSFGVSLDETTGSELEQVRRELCLFLDTLPFDPRLRQHVPDLGDPEVFRAYCADAAKILRTRLNTDETQS